MEILKAKFNGMSEMKNPEQVKIWFQRIFGDYFIGRKCRSQWLLRELSSISGEKTFRLNKCLDAGCDDGTITILLARKYPKWEIIGIDKNEGAIRAAKYRKCLYQIKNVHFVQADLLELEGSSFCEGNFDLVTSLDVLEHIENDIFLLKKFNRLLRQEGILILHVPAKDQSHFLRKPYFRSHPDHIRSGYTKKEIIDKVVKAGFNIYSLRRTFGAAATLGCDIENYLTVYRKATLLLSLVKISLLPLLHFLVQLDLLCSSKTGNGIMIKALKEQKL